MTLLLLLWACVSNDQTPIADTGSAPVASAGLGEISGDCGVISLSELNALEPSLFQSHLNFLSENIDYSALTEGGKVLIDAGNLGGDSVYSEVFAFEMMGRCDGAVLLKTEGTIAYTAPGKRTDFLVSLHGENIGVSVVRAVQWPEGSEYTVALAKEHLTGKLQDILESTALAGPEDAWNKQILSVIAWDQASADSVLTAWTQLSSEVKSDTIVWVTVTDGADRALYFSD